MTLSEVFYEAACRMSEGTNPYYFWELMLDVCGGRDAEDEFTLLFGDQVSSQAAAAQQLNWTLKDFRTFMLLMASEAVK